MSREDQGLRWLQRRFPGAAESLDRGRRAFAKSAVVAVLVEPRPELKRSLKRYSWPHRKLDKDW